jgi:CubicO group peptidase (beta-lactamase class C family)
MRRPALRLATAAILLVGAVACGDDDDGAAPTTTAPATTVPAESTASVAASTTLVPSAPAPTGTAPAPAPGYPAQPAGVPFPTTEWPTGPLPAGVDRAAIDAAVDAAFGAADAGGRVRSVVVVQGGRLVYERYHPKDGPDEVMSSYSVAKSFTSALVGMLIGDGTLALEEHPPRPEWPAGDPRQAITLHQLLQMSSGLQWTENTSIVPLVVQWFTSPSAAALVAARPLVAPPGTTFNYSTGTSALIAGIAADALGGCTALDDYIRTRLLEPLGITSAKLIEDGGGCFVGGLGMDMTTRDFARFGLLYLRGGQWDGRQLLPAGWVDETRVPAATDASYGLHWRLSPDGASFSAEGLFNQRILVIPGSDLVIATNSTNGGDPDPMVRTILQQFGATA